MPPAQSNLSRLWPIILIAFAVGLLVLRFSQFQTIRSARHSASEVARVKNARLSEAVRLAEMGDALRLGKQFADLSPQQFEAVGRDPDEPLLRAIERSRLSVVELLIDLGWKATGSDGSGSPLQSAVLTGDTKLVSCLITAGADPSQANVIGTTPLMWAARAGDSYMTEELLSHGAKPNTTRPPTRAFLAHSFSTKEGARQPPGAGKHPLPEKLGCTALTDAVYAESVQTVKVLLKHGARTDIRSSDGELPIDSARRFGATEIVKLLLQSGGTKNR